MPVTRALGNLARLSGIDFANSPIWVAIYLVASISVAIGAALLIFKYFEAPALEYLKRALQRRAAVQST
jgi:peptidoglycan/LPS O-acetylase OafA/YrhL